MPDPVTAFEWKIEAQSQTGSKGLESNMKVRYGLLGGFLLYTYSLKPAANWTQLEHFDDSGEKPYLKEYEGRGLLKDKAVLITGGDSGIGRSVAILMA